MTKIVIVDDEERGRETLATLVERFCPETTLVGTADSAESGFQLISAQQPDLVLLDVEMPGGNGFDLLEKFDRIDFSVVFTTAYGHYAIRAIRYSALDYLLKPIEIADLRAAVSRVQKAQQQPDIQPSVAALLANIKHQHASDKRIVLSDTNGLVVVRTPDIVRFESENSYTTVFLQNGSSYVQSRNLGEFETMLGNHDSFIRVHRSHMVNLDFVDRYVKGEGGYAVMQDGTNVEISRRRRADFLERLSHGW